MLHHHYFHRQTCRSVQINRKSYSFVRAMHSYLKMIFFNFLSPKKCCEINLPNSNVSCSDITYCDVIGGSHFQRQHLHQCNKLTAMHYTELVVNTHNTKPN